MKEGYTNNEMLTNITNFTTGMTIIKKIIIIGLIKILLLSELIYGILSK